MNTELIPRQTLSAMTGAYALACEEIAQASALYKQARERLEAAFGGDYSFRYPQQSGRPISPEDSAPVVQEWKRDAWRAMVGRLELRRLMSVKRCQELDDQLEEKSRHYGKQAEPLPDLTFENVVAMLETTAGQVKDFMVEAVQEVFEFLRPHRSEYKTNSEFEVGRKVIKGWWIRPGYGNHYEISYSGNAQAEITAMDNVFHLLDGKGPIKTHYGPLYEAIQKTTYAIGKGETEYFKFKCFHNGNLHLEFKRLDLLAKLNKIAGGNRLKPENKVNISATS